jgi:hypothetical protein
MQTFRNLCKIIGFRVFFPCWGINTNWEHT